MRSIMTNSVSDPEMALFPSRGVLRGFPGCDVQQHALPEPLVRPSSMKKSLISGSETD